MDDDISAPRKLTSTETTKLRSLLKSKLNLHSSSSTSTTDKQQAEEDASDLLDYTFSRPALRRVLLFEFPPALLLFLILIISDLLHSAPLVSLCCLDNLNRTFFFNFVHLRVGQS